MRDGCGGGLRRPTIGRSRGPAPLPIAIYADESCLGNGREGSNPGGAAGVIEYVSPSGRLSRRDYWVSEPGTTNNRMALRSVIEAFRGISRKGVRFRVTFTSDSQYLVKGMSEWVFGWMSRGWKKKDGPILNLELWMERSRRCAAQGDVAVGARTRGTSAERVRERSRRARREGADDLGRHRRLEFRRMAGDGTRKRTSQMKQALVALIVGLAMGYQLGVRRGDRRQAVGRPSRTR